MLFVVLTNPDGSTQLVYIVRPLSFLLDEEGPCAKWHAYGSVALYRMEGRPQE